MSLLSAKELLPVVQVCHQLRSSVCEASFLWTGVDRIDEPSALQFVLERSKDLPVSITNLRIEETDDVRLQLIASHMSHVRVLGLSIAASFGNITHGTRAYTLFATPAPILRRLSFTGPRDAENVGLPPVHVRSSSTKTSSFLFSGVAPQLDSLHVRGVQMTYPFLRRLPDLESLQTFSIGKTADFNISQASLGQVASTILSHLITLNVELAGWETATSAPAFTTSLRRINIRWTSRGPMVPDDAVPSHAAWKQVKLIHVTHVRETSSDCSSILSATIPATCAPYQTICIRNSGTADRRIHVRAVDVEDRERMLCGLHPSTVAGLVSRIPASRLSAITVTTAAVALGVLSNCVCPAVCRVRLVSNTNDVGWVNTFARDILSVTTLECIEFCIDANVSTFAWTDTALLRVLACCMAAGSILNQVVFLGFEPEARCVSQAATFATRVVVDCDWREHSDERIWFARPSFEWM